jgi:DNA-binding Xre family transcriptional regulator
MFTCEPITGRQSQGSERKHDSGSIARKLGISRAALTRLENSGQNTTITTLEQITKALKCSVGDLFKKM